MRTLRIRCLIFVCLIAAPIYSGCTWIDGIGGAPSPSAPSDSVDADGSNSIQVAPAHTTHPFDRADYLGDWAQEQGECLDTRDRVLIEESLEPVTFVTNANCVVLSGIWIDIYAESTEEAQVTDPDELVIDHIVSLEEAHRSGAWQWSQRKKQSFANDLANLTAVRKSSAIAKADKDLTHFLPPNPGAHCAFILSVLRTKNRWDLSMDEAEATEVRKFDALCDFEGMEEKLELQTAEQ